VNFGQWTLPWQLIFWRETAKSWHTPPLLFALSSYNGWDYRNADCCVNIDYDSSTSDINFVNIGPVTPDILLLICVGGWVRTRQNTLYAAFNGYSLGGCSIASLQVSKKCTVAFAPGGLHDGLCHAF